MGQRQRAGVATLWPLLVAASILLSDCSRPCDEPLRYRLGTLDPRFGISERELLTALRRAEEAWEDTSQINLFRFAEDGPLAINLVYDARQMTAQDNTRRKYAMDQAGDLAEVAKSRYETAKGRFEIARRNYEMAVAKQDALVARHNRNVENWNSSGGGTPADFQAIEREKAELTTSIAALEQQREDVTKLLERVNDLSVVHNEYIDEVNANVEAVNATAGQEFRQGRFVKDVSGIRVDVFEYMDREDLVHLLAHEMGHALGLEHNNNPKSIMYGQNTSRNAKPTVEDLEALRQVCRR